MTVKTLPPALMTSPPSISEFTEAANSSPSGTDTCTDTLPRTCVQGPGQWGLGVLTSTDTRSLSFLMALWGPLCQTEAPPPPLGAAPGQGCGGQTCSSGWIAVRRAVAQERKPVKVTRRQEVTLSPRRQQNEREVSGVSALRGAGVQSHVTCRLRGQQGLGGSTGPGQAGPETLGRVCRVNEVAA